MCGTVPVGPGRIVEERVNDIDCAQTGVDGCMHVAAQCLGRGRGRGLGEGCVACVDGAVEDVEHDRTQQFLSVGEVPIQRRDPHAGSLRNGIAGWFTPDVEDQFDRGVEKSPTVAPSVGPDGRAVRRAVDTYHEAEYIPPLVEPASKPRRAA